MKGIFRGIEKGMAIVEFPCTTSNEQGELVWTTHLTKQEVDGKIHCCNFGFGYQPGARWMYPVLPNIGQEVEYEPETPDMAGHLVAWIGPVKDENPTQKERRRSEKQ